MKTYRIHIHSVTTFLISGLIVMLSGMYSLTKLPKDLNQFLVFAIMALLIGLSVYLASQISMAKILIEIDKDGFKHKWIRKFLFAPEPDIHLKWNQIEEYFFEEDRSFDKFQIRLPNNQRYRFHRQNVIPMKDDFDRFQFDFPNLIRNIEAAEEQKIVRGKTIFEETGFKWVLAVFSIGVFILLGAAIFGGASGINIGTIGMLAAAVGFYWIKVLGNQRKKEDNNEYRK